MPDGFDTMDTQIAQRGMGPRGGFPRGGFPGGGMFPGGGFPRGGFPGGGFRRFPHRFPFRRFPRPIFFPFFFGFPQTRCVFFDEFGRCCDQFGRCFFFDEDVFPFASTGGSSFGVPGSWGGNETAGADSAAVYSDMTDYDYEV